MNPLLLLGLGAVALLALSGTASASTSSSSWPPSASVQAQLTQQIASMYAGVNPGQPMSASDQAELAQLVAQAPAQYVTTLPAGQAPTVAGYQQWAMSAIYQGIMGGAQLQQGLGSSDDLSGTYTTSGPLGYGCASPYPIFDVWGNALFVNDDGSPWIVKGPHWDYAGNFYGD
jgi:hypothetical protein